jgi:hypothetical protein
MGGSHSPLCSDRHWLCLRYNQLADRLRWEALHTSVLTTQRCFMPTEARRVEAKQRFESMEELVSLLKVSNRQTVEDMANNPPKGRSFTDSEAFTYWKEAPRRRRRFWG